jgi:hypothetical protein
MWLFQENVLSIINPRNFVAEAFIIFITLQELCLVKKCMKYIFPKFRESNLEGNHLFVFLKTMLITFSEPVK